MAEALYRTYRPQTFADVVHQQHIRITLQHALTQDRVAHAYLFAGPRGVGKTTLARILARAVNCTDLRKDGEPCNQCATCTAILKNSCLDIIEIDAASQTGVDNVRENIIQNARSIPSMAKRKVFIIDEVHMLSTSAFNALLKLLEEPPAHAMFILATTEIHRIPETIISRTQRFDFKKVSVEDITKRLLHVAAQEQRQVDTGVAERIARRAGGSVRDAETMLGQLFSFAEKRITNDIADLVLPRSDRQVILQLLDECLRSATLPALTTFHTFCDEGGDIPSFVHDLVQTTRGLLLMSVDAKLVQHVAPDFDPADIQKLLAWSTSVSVGELERLIELLLTAERRLSTATMMELPVELAIISFTINQSGSEQVAPRPTVRPVTTAPTPTEPRQSPPPEPPAKKAATQKKKSSGQLTLQAVREVWQSIQRTIGHTHPSVGLSVQHAIVGDVSDEEVILHVPFKLHAERLSDPKHSTAVKTAFEDALGQPVRLSIIVADMSVEPPKPKEASVVRTSPTTSLGTSPQPSPVKKGDLWDAVVASFGEA